MSIGGSPQIGTWWTDCCERGLTQITSQEELDAVLQDIIDIDGDYTLQFWKSQREALEEILKGYGPDSSDFTRMELLEELRRLEAS